MPYRRIILDSGDGVTETLLVRIPDAAVIAWLEERSRLRAKGFPDRAPDVDTASLRAWLPRRGEERHPYFASNVRLPGAEDTTFPIYTVTWHAPGVLVTKVIVIGLGDGSIVSRVVIDHESGERAVDKARTYGPDISPGAAWGEIETVVMAVDRSGMGWDAHSPMVTDYADFLALDAEVEAAETDARAAGLLAPMKVH